MKKWFRVMTLVFVLAGCSDKAFVEVDTLPNGVANVNWFQKDGSDYQLFLSEDGTVSYYSPSAGNPYHYFDMCKQYAYNEENKTFSFNTDHCTMTFIHLSADARTLELMVDGEKITFEKK